eukprot:12284920-Heterocapsa_arctica.AAC.1
MKSPPTSGGGLFTTKDRVKWLEDRKAELALKAISGSEVAHAPVSAPDTPIPFNNMPNTPVPMPATP